MLELKVVLVAVAVLAVVSWEAEGKLPISGSRLRQTCVSRNPIMNDDNFVDVLNYFEACYDQRINLEPGARRGYLRSVGDRLKHTSEKFIKTSKLTVNELLPAYMRVKDLYGKVSCLRTRRDAQESSCEPLYLILPPCASILTMICIIILLLLLAIAVMGFAWFKQPFPECHCLA